MNIKKVLATCLLALAPAVALSLPIVSMPTLTSGTASAPLRHNLFHDSSIGSSGANGNVLAWFDLDTTMSSTWDPNTGALVLHVNIFSDSAQTNLIGTGLGTSNTLLGGGFGGFNNASLGFISWAFSGAGAVGILGTGLTMEFINHSYAPDTDGNLANTYVNNTVTLWGADGTHNGGGGFPDASMGVDMVFVVMPEPGILLLMALGLLGLGAITRKL